MRVLVVEDSVLLRAGLGRLLEDEDMEMVGEAGDADAFLREWERTRPDISIVDVRMPPTHTDEGIRASIELREKHPDARILVLSQYVEEQYASDTGSQDTVAYTPPVELYAEEGGGEE